MKLLKKLTQGKRRKYSLANKTGYPVIFFYLGDISSVWQGICFMHGRKHQA